MRTTSVPLPWRWPTSCWPSTLTFWPSSATTCSKRVWPRRLTLTTWPSWGCTGAWRTPSPLCGHSGRSATCGPLRDCQDWGEWLTCLASRGPCSCYIYTYRMDVLYANNNVQSRVKTFLPGSWNGWLKCCSIVLFKVFKEIFWESVPEISRNVYVHNSLYWYVSVGGILTTPSFTDNKGTPN